MKIKIKYFLLVLLFAGAKLYAQSVPRAGSGIVNLVATEVASVWSGIFLGIYTTGNGKPCTNPADFDWADIQFKEVKFEKN